MDQGYLLGFGFNGKISVMNVTKLKQHRRIKRHDKQQWQKQAFKEAFEEKDEKLREKISTGNEG